MIAAAADRVRGVAEMLICRPGWRQRFDVSQRGLWESFAAAIPALPLFALSLAGQNAVSVALAEAGAARPASLAQSAVVYLCLWAYFPLVAAVFVRVFDLREGFVPWVVVHNWTVLFLLALQGTLGALVLTGLLSPEAYLIPGQYVLVFAIYAHCRVAIGALDAPWPVAIGGACLGVLVWLLIQLQLVNLFSGAAIQA